MSDPTDVISDTAARRGLDNPWTRIKLRFAGALAILLLSVIGIAFIDVHSQKAFRYWAALAIISGLVCMALAALDQRGKGGQLAMVGRQAVHWLGLLIALWLLFYLYRIDFVQAQGTAVFAVLLLVLTTWQAGAHFDPVFLLISVALGAVAYLNAFFEQYLVLITIPVIVAVAVLFLWQRHRLLRS